MSSGPTSTCLPYWSIIPFVAVLLSMAILPMVVPHWWNSNRNKALLSLVISLPPFVLLLYCRPNLLMHSMQDYVSFIALIGALFVISGGIHIRGAFAGTPLVNTIYLAIGAVLANLIGTTGASLLLIRPYMHANNHRKWRAHLIVFFIFLVSNVAGSLTPLGDPPLFLGFLRGVPFYWTLNLFPQWALAVGLLLVLFNVYDQYVFNREDIENPGGLVEMMRTPRPIHIEGGRNVIYLLGVIAAATLSGCLGWPKGIQVAMMLAMALLCWLGTPDSVHRANHFDFGPIVEVAILFLGIFVTMIPALEIINQQATAWNINHPWQFFWMAGLLSSFLDNAPTYLTFTALASGTIGGSINDLTRLVHSGDAFLRAISCGSVFMGANTYIGNGPNLMIRSIAEHSGIQMPSFAGYLLYSGLILVPLFVVITLVFFQ